MARRVRKFSATEVRNLSKPGRHADGEGLYLNIAAGGSKSWMFLWMKDGKRREMGLGSFPAISLATAREKATECQRFVAEGKNPLQERDRQRAVTFDKAVEAFLESMAGSWKNDKHKAQWEMTLGDAYCKPISKMSVENIDTEEVLKVLMPVWQTKSETASRLRGRIERVLDFAQVRGWRFGENPARWRGHLKNALPARKKLTCGHHAAMSYDGVPAFMERLRSLPGLSARGLELLILTASRSNEIVGATGGEFDLKAGVWTVPKERMKANREHRVPLTHAALAVLGRIEAGMGDALLMPGQIKGRPLSNMAFAMLIRREKLSHFTVHGFRSAFRDWAGDETTFAREVAEAALAHRVGDETERAYRRSDALARHRELMDAWAKFCGGTATSPAAVE